MPYCLQLLPYCHALYTCKVTWETVSSIMVLYYRLTKPLASFKPFMTCSSTTWRNPNWLSCQQPSQLFWEILLKSFVYPSFHYDQYNNKMYTILTSLISIKVIQLANKQSQLFTIFNDSHSYKWRHKRSRDPNIYWDLHPV